MRNGIFTWSRYSFIAAAAALPLNLWAQATTPGQVGDTLKRPPELVAPKPAPAVQDQQPAAPAAPAGASAVQVKVSSFQFKGNTVYSSAQLASLLSSYLNRPLTLIDIYGAADVISDYYTGSGYTLASVNVPPQKITDGTILLEISEGRIGKVTVDNGRRKPERVKAYLGLKDGSIYRAAPVERGMLTLNELPGLTARAVVKPGAEFGTSDLVVRTADDAVSGAVFADNSGRESIGEVRYGAAVNFNNPFRLDDQISLLGLVSSGTLLKYLSAGYNLPIAADGTRLSFSYGFADFEVDNTPLTGDSQNARIAVSFPLVRSSSEVLNFTAGVADTRTGTEFGGVDNGGTSITVLELGALYNHVSKNSAMTQVSAMLATNFDEQERSDFIVPAGEDVDGKQMARIELDVLHVQPLPARMSVQVRGNTVWSPDPLSDPSAYSIGGPNSVRGFPPSEIRGDRGYFGQLTLQQRWQAGPVRIIPRIFVDSGQVFVVDPLPGQQNKDSLTSAGIGTDIEWSTVSLKVDVSDPQGSRIASDGDDSTRVFATLSVGF